MTELEPTSEIKNLSEADRIANFVKFREFLISMINKNNQQPQPGLSLSPGKVEQTIKIVCTFYFPLSI